MFQLSDFCTQQYKDSYQYIVNESYWAHRPLLSLVSAYIGLNLVDIATNAKTIKSSWQLTYIKKKDAEISKAFGKHGCSAWS
jgi:hypothetical protein